MKRIQIWASTACRSDFDLLSPVYRLLASDPRFSFGLIVSGAHLSERFGLTVQHVRDTGLPIVAEIDSLTDTGMSTDRPATAARWLLEAGDVIREGMPDALIAVGDREDAIATCLLGAYLRIPVAHVFGGDHGQTADVDNLVRHASSKLASLHFVMTETHRRRLLAIGEPAERIHVVGNPALDAFVATPAISRTQLFQKIGATFSSDEPYAFVVHHPTFEEPTAGAEELSLILKTTIERDLATFVGLPNVDEGSRAILHVIDLHRTHPRVCVFDGLPRAEFVNLLRNAAVLLGNSSMGLLEAPSIPLPVVNVGRRQRGRMAAQNVLFVDAEFDAVRDGLERALSPEFLQLLQGLSNPYGDGQTAKRIVDILATELHPELTYKMHDPLS